jgi:hypothetical protein
LVRGIIGDRVPTIFVMTRESTEEILAANGKTLTDCAGECEVQTGRLLGADYVVSGRFAVVGSRITLALRLHRTGDARLLGSEEALAYNIDQLVDQTEPTVIALIQHAAATARADQSEIPASKLARESAQRMAAKDYAAAIARAHAALNYKPTSKTTLGLAFRSLGYGYANINDRPNALVWLEKYRPFCARDCQLVDAYVGNSAALWQGKR